jgi:uncharacterized protein DUF3987
MAIGLHATGGRMRGSNGPVDKSRRPIPDAFHGFAGKFIRAIEPHTEADPAALLTQFLAGFGFLAGRRAFALADGTKHFANLFVGVVGRTAKSRKGTSWSRVRSFFETFSRWPRERVKNGLSSGEGLIADVTKASDKRLLVVETEAGSMLRQMERSGNILSQVLRSAWDGTDLNVMTKNAPASVSNAHICLVLQITAEELRERIDTNEIWNGFANRILWCEASRSQLLPYGGVPDETVINNLCAELREILKWLSKLKGAELKLDNVAKTEWRAIYCRLSKERPGPLGSVISRSEAHVLRLALTYALLDRSTKIRVEHLRAALGVWDYCEVSARRIFGDSLGDPKADAALDFIREHPRTTRSQISQQCFKRHLPHRQLARLLSTLEEHGLASRETSRTAGRSVEKWTATSTK